MASKLVSAPMKISKSNLKLLKNSDRSWTDWVTPEIAVRALRMTLRQIRHLMYNGELATKGFGRERLVSVDSIRKYKPLTLGAKISAALFANSTAEQRSERSRRGAAKYTREQRSERSQRAATKYSAEQRSARAKAREANKTGDVRKAAASKGGKALWADKTSEERSATLKARWSTVAPGVQSANGKKGNSARWAATTADERRDFARVHFTSEHRSAGGKKRWAKVPPEDRSAMAKANAAKISPERRTAISKARWTGLTKEQRRAPGRKGGSASWAGKTDGDRKAWGKDMAERRKAKLREEIERELALGSDATSAKIPKKLSPKRQTAADFYADWVREGRPSSGDAIVEIAKAYYSKKILWSEQYPSRRHARRDQMIRGFKALLSREQNRIIAGARKKTMPVRPKG